MNPPSTPWPARVTLLAAAAALPLAWLLPATQAQLRPGPPVPMQAASPSVENSVKRAVDFMLANLDRAADGSDALMVTALLKAGVSKDDPRIENKLVRIAGMVKDGTYTPRQHQVYDAGVCLMALGNADPRKYRPEMEAITRFIIGRQTTTGAWDYPNRQAGDTSITQYALLGLWEAARNGINVPSTVWDRAAAWHIRTQLANGAFCYHPDEIIDARHTMTIAAIGSLEICRLHLYPNALARFVVEAPKEEEFVPDDKPKRKFKHKRFGILEPVDSVTQEVIPDEKEVKPAGGGTATRLNEINNAVTKALDWMAKNFTVSKPNPDSNPIYYLYGMERAMALVGNDLIGEHDWYAEGAQHLVAKQGTDGSWDCHGSLQNGSAFGVLFLVRATAKSLKTPRMRATVGSGILAGGRGLPDNLNDVEMVQGEIKVKKLEGELVDLLGELEKVDGDRVDAAQEALLEVVRFDQQADLIGQIDRLKRLARDKRPEVRRIAMWALGRSTDVTVAPWLIEGLLDSDLDVVVEARNGLRVLSRHLESDADPPLTVQERQQEAARWRAWYRSVRPYHERDDLSSAAKPN